MASGLQPHISRHRIGKREQEENPDSIPCIFVIESKRGDVRLLEIALEEQNIVCELLVTTDAEDSLRFIETLKASSPVYPALALIYLNCPKGTGRKAARALRDNRAWRDIPVLVLSSSDTQKAGAALKKVLAAPSSGVNMGSGKIPAEAE